MTHVVGTRRVPTTLRAELEAIRRSVAQEQPYGSDAWRKQTAIDLWLESTMRSRGRPWDRTPKHDN